MRRSFRKNRLLGARDGVQEAFARLLGARDGVQEAFACLLGARAPLPLPLPPVHDRRETRPTLGLTQKSDFGKISNLGRLTEGLGGSLTGVPVGEGVC